MSGGPDLTRWNRAGLSRFRYVDGNARTFLEDLRLELASRFPEWAPLALGERTYDTPSADWGWEIARAFARAGHVLGEHLDAYANEGFLRTATQWDSVRKLVAMLDVQPAPPASASTPLVIEAKGEPGRLAAGFAVRHTPTDGGAPLIFETLADLDVDAALNALRMDDWNRSPAPLIDLRPELPLPPIARRTARVIQSVGPTIGDRLDRSAPLGNSFFAVADFRAFQPSELRLWEAKSKAEFLLDFPWTSVEMAPIARLRLPELLRQSPSSLAAQTGRTVPEMVRLQEDVRTAQAMLDETVFAAARLDDLLARGAAPPDPPPLWLAPEDSGISAGQVAVVVRATPASEEGAVVRIRRVERASSEITLDAVAHQPAFENWTRGVSSLLARPELIAVAHVSGSPSALTFDAPHGLTAGDRVAWRSGGAWVFADVEGSDDVGLRLTGSARPAVGAEVFLGVDVQGLTLPVGYRVAATPVTGGLQLLADTERSDEKDANQNVRFHRVTRSGASTVVYVPGGARPAGRVAAVAPAQGDGRFRFGGKPGKLASGQWVVGDDRGRLIALRVASIEEFEDHFAVTFESVVEPAPQVAGLPVLSIMGVGPVAERLLQARLRTVGELAATAPSQAVPGLTATERLEVRAKAQLVTSFPFDPRDLGPVLDRLLLDVMGTAAATLADQLGKPLVWARQLIEQLRLLQAVIDEPPLSGLRVRDLLPIGPPRPVRDFELTRLDRLYAVFKHTLRPSRWDVNDTPVSGSHLLLEAKPPHLLSRGRQLVVERGGLAREATVLAVDPAARTVDIAPALAPEDGFTRHNLVLRANVTRAGHGEAKPSKVLGSGDAARRSQSFVLKEKDVAFVADPTQPAGVAAAVQVTIAGQTWQQVGTLRDSRATDPHYEARLTEDGELAVTFGDGLRGRRLPTGTSNVRATARVGTGLAGNLPPGSLTKPARPHPRVAAVLQPLDATGGNDQQEVASLKAQAPKSVLTLERAVSLTDFSALAARQASVWQARAFALPTGGGRHASVEVVVVPAGGGALGPLASDLTAFLIANGLPGVEIRVSAYRAKPFDLVVEIEVKSAEYDAEDVRKSVEAALLDAFSLKRRALGTSLFASELYEVVEGVPGVESSRIDMGFGPVRNERVLRAEDREVVFLDPDRSVFSVSVREFQL